MPAPSPVHVLRVTAVGEPDWSSGSDVLGLWQGVDRRHWEHRVVGALTVSGCQGRLPGKVLAVLGAVDFIRPVGHRQGRKGPEGSCSDVAGM